MADCLETSSTVSILPKRSKTALTWIWLQSGGMLPTKTTPRSTLMSWEGSLT